MQNYKRMINLRRQTEIAAVDDDDVKPVAISLRNITYLHITCTYKLIRVLLETTRLPLKTIHSS